MEIQYGCQDDHQGHGKTEMALTSLFNSHRNLLLCVLTCMFCPQNNKRGDISMANDVYKSKMAVNVATTNMNIIKLPLPHYLIHG